MRKRGSNPMWWLRGAPIAFLLAATAATLSAQQPGQDAREIPPTPGVTPIDTPASARTSVTPLRRTTPMTTRTPRPAGAGTVHGTDGRGTPHSPSERSDPRNAGTWTVFGILVVALGFVTVRMRRHRFDAAALEPPDPDLPPSSYPYPYTYP